MGVLTILSTIYFSYCTAIIIIDLHKHLLPDQFTKLVTKEEHSYSSFGHFSLEIAQPILQYQIPSGLQTVALNNKNEIYS
jgi:prepilin signal peptidase PulO-like enzyme (type II secretory pathway)